LLITEKIIDKFTLLLYTINHIKSIIKAAAILVTDAPIEYLLIDSRKIVFPSTTLFFAIAGERRSGESFIAEAYERGVRNFVVPTQFDITSFKEANFLFVANVLQSMQTLAAYHRTQFSIPIIGITGSNGKTIVKEWLFQLLQNDYNIVRSPRSYNSQIGVPLSVWQINAQNTLGIFEAGISTTNEMQALEQIIQPTIGVFTNIGEAHREGFKNDTEKLSEKLKLFSHCKQLVYCKDYLSASLIKQPIETFSWSRNDQRATLFIESETKSLVKTSLVVVYKNASFNIVIPFTDAASIDNAISCCAVLLMMGYEVDSIAKRLLALHPIEMRMQLYKGVNNCSVLNDSYSNDISSFSIALDYLKQQSGNNATTVILSDILQSGLADEVLYHRIATELKQRKITRLIGIGENMTKYRDLFLLAVTTAQFYPSTPVFLEQTTTHQFRDEFILLKGARIFAFERISKWLALKVHQTVLEINLSALAHNLKEYQKNLLPTTKLMAMVKAFSYGSGSAEIARVLQFCKVDYLAVAYADEGVELRKAGISLPMMVMNADAASFDALIEHGLEPEIYSFHLFHSLQQYLLEQGITQFPIHIKVNTGMNRLGFEPEEIDRLGMLLQQSQAMVVKSVFSHLAGSEAAAEDGFTAHQASLFDAACNSIEASIGYSFIKHIANSAAIFRHQQLQYGMVRLGIGLYGVDSTHRKHLALETVATLQSTIAQIRKVKAGQTIGYNQKGKIDSDRLIATIRIGYADGYSRRLGNGVGQIYVGGKMAPVIGSVCMDMIMVDITDVPHVQEGDTVEIFGKHLPVQQVAEWSDTIPYEVMTGISQRVKRVYIEE